MCFSKAFFTLLAIVVLATGPVAAPLRVAPDTVRVREAMGVVDIHAHLSPRVWPFVLHTMRKNSLRLIVNLSGGSNQKAFSVMKAITEKSNGRILHFFNPDFQKYAEPGWAYEQSSRLKLSVEGFGYRGLKIAKVLGLGARDANGLLVEVDDPRLQPLWEMAAFLGVPVAIHTGDPRAFWLDVTPANERYGELSLHPSWSYFDRVQSGDVPSWHTLLGAFEEVVRGNPGTDFIGVHFGNAGEDLDFVEGMLASYPNFYVDIAARLGEIGRHDPGRVRELFIKYQERILFGTDIGISPRGLMLGAPGKKPSQVTDIKPFYDTHWRWLETSDSPMPHPTPIQGDWPIHGISLPDSVLEKIYVVNAVGLLGLDRAPQKWEAEGQTNQP